MFRTHKTGGASDDRLFGAPRSRRCVEAANSMIVVPTGIDAAATRREGRPSDLPSRLETRYEFAGANKTKAIRSG